MRICFWDLETTNLSALMGRIVTSAFLEWDADSNKEAYVFRCDDTKFRGRSKIDDGKLALATRDELEKYDLICGHNIRNFDIPFLNARLAKAGHRPLNKHFIIDTMYYVGGISMRIGSRKLVNVQKFFNLGEAKTEIDWECWQEAALGEKDAMEEVVVHNIQDVKVLRELYPIILPLVANIHR